MNASTTLDEKFVTIGEIHDYSCDQEEVLDYSSFQKIECSAQLKTKASNKEELLRGIGRRNYCKDRWNSIDRVSDELQNGVDTLKDQ